MEESHNGEQHLQQPRAEDDVFAPSPFVTSSAMDSWKPLQPTNRRSSPSLDAYAPPAHSTRQAPPAHPHRYPIDSALLPSRRSSSKKTSLFSWRSGGKSSQYAAPPVDASHPSVSEVSGTLTYAPGQGRAASLHSRALRDVEFIGRLPASAHIVIADVLSVDDLARYMLVCRRITILLAREEVWNKRSRALQWIPVKGIEVEALGILTDDPQKPSLPSGAQLSKADEQWSDFSSGKVIDEVEPDAFAVPLAVPTHSSDPTAYSASSSTVLPSLHSVTSYRVTKSYKLALRPYLRSFETSDSPEGSLLFSTSSWGPLEQHALLRNLIRALLPPSAGGGGLFNLDEPPGSAPDLTSPTRPRSATVLAAVSQLISQLLLLFTASSDRRSDALRAAVHGATGTAGAVNRAEGDMRVLAKAIWDLGCAGREVAEQSKDSDEPVLEGVDNSTSDRNLQEAANRLGSEARSAWLDTQEAKVPLRWTTDPNSNIITSPLQAPALDFTAMDREMSAALEYISSEGSLIARIFPPEQGVLLEWARRIVDRLVSEYIQPLLLSAKSHSVHLYLRSCAATFTQTLRVAETLHKIEAPNPLPAPSILASDSGNNPMVLQRESHDWQAHLSRVMTREACSLVVYEAWEVLMGDYLAEEKDWIKTEMERVAGDWEDKLSNQAAASRVDAAFLTSQNPAAVKRTVLSSFKNVLLLPVTVVPRTAANVGGAVFRSAGKGVSQLNPLRWQTSTANDTNRGDPSSESYIDFSNGGPGLEHDESGDEDDDRQITELDDDWDEEVRTWREVASHATKASHQNENLRNRGPSGPSLMADQDATSSKPKRLGTPAQLVGKSTASPTTSRSGTPIPGIPRVSEKATPSSLKRMQLLLSLDTALEMIHLNRNSLKRIENFTSFPDPLGSQVHHEIEEVAGAFLQCLGERHVNPAFQKATMQITSWTPTALGSNDKSDQGAKSEPRGDQHVEPLVHFFELVHVGDTIAQMVQVYFDQELTRHIDRTDFFNAVVREKKKFEKALDEAVAAGLNAGVDLLMGQIEHIVATTQDPRDFYPEPGKEMDLGKPTPACEAAITCLKAHCNMLLGCTDKNVLEVFWQEIGIRLHAIICKHLKRQIISLDGGFQVIADLNAYYSFVATFRQSSLLPYFEALKMLGNVYVIEDPKELATLVRDTSVFRGTLTPDDVYEFLQARCDFKAIEKAIDKEMYGFKVAEDCKVM